MDFGSRDASQKNVNVSRFARHLGKNSGLHDEEVKG
jgi:hypothetical protein